MKTQNDPPLESRANAASGREAPEMVKADRPARKHGWRWLWVLPGVIILLIIVLSISPITWTSYDVKDYPGGVAIKTVYCHEMVTPLSCYYILLALDDTESWIIWPIFYNHVREPPDQVLIIRGREANRTRGTYVYHPSPEGAYVAAVWAYGPVRIYSANEPSFHEVSSRPWESDRLEDNNHSPSEESFEFRFVRWSDEGRFLLDVSWAHVFSPQDAGNRTSRTYRVEAATGAVSFTGVVP